MSNPIKLVGDEDTTGYVKEDAILKATGELSAIDTDPHATLSWSVANNGAGAYGTFSID